MNVPVEQDERTVTAENASYRWGYAALTYALLLDVMYRGMFRHEAAWDLIALVVGGGAICTATRLDKKTWGHGWVMKVALGMIIAAIAAFIAAVTTTE